MAAAAAPVAAVAAAVEVVKAADVVVDLMVAAAVTEAAAYRGAAAVIVELMHFYRIIYSHRTNPAHFSCAAPAAPCAGVVFYLALRVVYFPEKDDGNGLWTTRVYERGRN